MAGRVTGVDQEIAVHLRYLRAADAQAPATGGVDQLPGALIRWILECRAAGLFADRLRGFTVVLYLVHPRPNLIRGCDASTKARRGKNDGSVDAAVAIGEFHIRIGKNTFFAVAADADSLDQDIPGLRAVGAGVHAQRAADGAGDAEEKFQPADVGRRCRFRHALVERGRAGADDIAIGAGFAETAWTEPDHRTRHAAIAHDQVGADADHIDRKLGRQMREEIGE